MTPIATVIFVVGIVGLFWLDRDRKAHTSWALWLPIAWLLINASRPVSAWLLIGSPSTSLVDQSVEGSPLDRNIFFGLIAAGAIVILVRRKTVAKFLRWNWLIVVFVLYCAASISWSDYPDVAFKRWIKSLGDLVMIWIVLTDTDRLTAVKRLLSRVAFVLIPLSILFVKYYPELARYYSPWDGTMFISGVAMDKNMLGMTCLVSGLGACWRLLGALQDRGWERARRLIAHGTIFGMTLWLFWKADSMTPLSCFVLAGTLMVITSLVRAARKPAVIHLLVAAMVFVPFAVLFLNIGRGTLETLGRNPTLTGRTEIWSELLDLNQDPVLGTGFQSFWVGKRLQKIWAKSGYLYGLNEAHNAYLEMFLNLGWVGVAFLAAILVTGYRHVLAGFRQDPNTGSLWLAIYAGAIVYGYTEASAFGMTSPIWIVFLLAITLVPKSLVKTNPALAEETVNADSGGQVYWPHAYGSAYEQPEG